MKIRLCIAIIILSSVISCVKEPVRGDEQQETLIPTTIIASLDDDTKTSLDGNSVLWKKDDRVTVFDGTGRRSFRVTYVYQDGSAKLEGDTGEGAGNKTWRFIYPESAFTERTDKYTKTYVQRLQDAVKGTFAPKVNVMSGIATPEQRGDNGKVSMKNVCGLVKIVVSASDITSITFAAKDDTKLSGRIGIDENDPVKITSSYSSHNSVTLASPDGSALSPGNYYIAALPCTLSGFVLYLTSSNGKVAKRSNSKELNIERNKIATISGFDTNLTWYWPDVTGIALGFNSENSNGGSWSVGTWPFNEAAPSSGGSSELKNIENNLTSRSGGYRFAYYSTSYNPMFGMSGFRFGQFVGDYLDFPAFEGKMLTGVKMRAGNNSDRPVIGYHNESQRLTANFVSEGSDDLTQGAKVSWTIAPYYFGDILCFVQQAATQPIALGSLVLNYSSFDMVDKKTIELDFTDGKNPFVAQDKLFSADWKQYTNSNCYTSNGFEFTINGMARLQSASTVNYRGLGFETTDQVMELPLIKGFRLSRIEIVGGNYKDGTPDKIASLLLQDSIETKYELLNIQTDETFVVDLTSPVLRHDERYKFRTTSITAIKKLKLTYTRVTD